MERLVLYLLALAIGGALEELLPKFAGVGFPVLLAAAVLFGSRHPLRFSMPFAVAAGAVEDALSGLPPFTSAGFFLAAALFARRLWLGGWALPVAYPAYQAWLWVWMTDRLVGNVYHRLLVAVPVGAVAAFAVPAVLLWAEGKAAIGED